MAKLMNRFGAGGLLVLDGPGGRVSIPGGEMAA